MTQYSLAVSKQAIDPTDPYYFPYVPDHSFFVDAEAGYTLQHHEGILINEGISIGAEVVAVEGLYGSNSIECNGTLYAGNGIILSGADSAVRVGATGVVSGTATGINLSAGLGSGNGSLDGAGSIVNQGIISGDYNGLYLSSNTDARVDITNSGMILAGIFGPADADHAAIYMDGSGTTRLVNSGLIEAELAHSWSFESVAVSTDVVVNNGTMVGNVTLGGGNDVFDTSKGKVVGTIDGGAGNDKIVGSALSDTISGGTGDDLFIFKTKPSASAVDHITDFTHGQDHIALSHALFQLDPGQTMAEAFKAIDATTKYGSDDHIIYRTDKGALYYDSDGAGGVKPVLLAILDHRPALADHDVLLV